VPWFPTTDEVAAVHLWPRVGSEFVEDVVWALTYMPHGGSGMTWSRSEVLDCPLSTALATIRRLDEQRQRESDAMKAAARKGRRR
jgi:hypothetical protein